MSINIDSCIVVSKEALSAIFIEAMAAQFSPANNEYSSLWIDYLDQYPDVLDISIFL